MSEAKRVNITISEAAHEHLRSLVDTLYGGNFSRFVSDAAIFYAGSISDAGRQEVEKYVAIRQAQVCHIPRFLHETGAQVSVLFCSYCGYPNPQQIDSISADTVNILCPACGNEQVIKGFRPSTTWIPLLPATQACCNYYSGERSGALDPQAIQLVKRHFKHRKLSKMTEEETAEVLAALELERVQLDKVRMTLSEGAQEGKE